MKKTTLAALIGSLLPGIGPGSNPNVALNGALPDVNSLNSAILNSNPFQETNYNVAANTAAFTLVGPQISGGSNNFLNLSGALGAGAALTLPTVAALLASLPANVQANPIGVSWQLRILNPAGTQTWTVTTNTGWTLTGTMTVPTVTWRDFVIQITSATTAVIQAVGAGVAP